MDRDVDGLVVAVTGATGGLGLAIATSFLEKGIKLAIIFAINENKGYESVATLKQKHGDDRVAFYKCNVVTDLDAIYEKILSNHGSVDILVNNAGVLDEGNIKRTIDINAVAVMEWTMKFYEHMRTDKGGKGGTIINVSSIYGHRITPYIPTYHATKFAVIGFSKSLGHQYNYKRSSVRVVTLCPGLTHTNLTHAPNVWEESILSDFLSFTRESLWQTSEYIGKSTVEIFEIAESGSVWLVEGTKPAIKWNV